MKSAILNKFEAALDSREPLNQLVELIREFKTNRCSQVEIYWLFESFLLARREQGISSDHDEDILAEAMDFIWMWGNVSPMQGPLFDTSLTYEEVEDFRRKRGGER